jgi:hypothetical protein
LRFSPRGQRQQRPAIKLRRGYPSLLEELQALQDALDASEERSNILATTLFDLLEAVPPETLERHSRGCRNRCRTPCTLGSMRGSRTLLSTRSEKSSARHRLLPVQPSIGFIGGVDKPLPLASGNGSDKRMNSSVKKRSTVIRNHKTSISLEDIFWACVRQSSRARNNHINTHGHA